MNFWSGTFFFMIINTQFYICSADEDFIDGMYDADYMLYNDLTYEEAQALFILCTITLAFASALFVIIKLCDLSHWYFDDDW